MCGSGTLLLEAALMALDIAPGLGRHFAFERLNNFDRRRWQDLLAANQGPAKPKYPLAIYGSDLSGAAIKSARANLAAAGLDKVVSLKQANVLEISAPAKKGMLLVTNPPYGVRSANSQNSQISTPSWGRLKKEFHRLARLLSAKRRPASPASSSASPHQSLHPLFNGALECRLFEYKMVEGEMKKKKPERVIYGKAVDLFLAAGPPTGNLPRCHQCWDGRFFPLDQPLNRPINVVEDIRFQALF